MGLNLNTVYVIGDMLVGTPGGGGGGGWAWTSFRDGDGFTQDLGGGTWRIRGPNDGFLSGWTVIKALAPSGGTIAASYSWSTTDGLPYDWPFYYVGGTEPTNSNVFGVGFRGTSPGNIVSVSPQSGVANVTYAAGQWVAFGIYSTDSGFGPGTIDLTGLPGTLTVIP